MRRFTQARKTTILIWQQKESVNVLSGERDKMFIWHASWNEYCELTAWPQGQLGTQSNRNTFKNII